MAAALLAFTSSAAMASDAETLTPEAQQKAYSDFLVELQRAVRTNDEAAILASLGFPLRVNGPENGSRTYRDVEDVRTNFGAVFDAPTKEAILKQDPQSIFSRDIGAMVGNGEVWFDYTCLDEECSEIGPIRIYAINHQ